MAFNQDNRSKNEILKFVETTAGDVAIRVVATDASGNDVSFAEDTAHTTGDPGYQMLAVRTDTAGTLAGTTGDYAPLQLDASGNLRINLTDSSGNELNVVAEDGVHSSGHTGLMTFAVRKDTPGTLAGTDGDYAPYQVDASGNLRVTNATEAAGEDLSNDVQATVHKPLAVSDYAPSDYQNYGSAITENVKATAGNVFAITGFNSAGTDVYLQLHNTATTPSAAAVPKFSFLLPASSEITQGSDFFVTGGAHFNTGVAMAISTTPGDYTAATTAGDYFTQVRYV